MHGAAASPVGDGGAMALASIAESASESAPSLLMVGGAAVPALAVAASLTSPLSVAVASTVTRAAPLPSSADALGLASAVTCSVAVRRAGGPLRRRLRLLRLPLPPLPTLPPL